MSLMRQNGESTGSKGQKSYIAEKSGTLRVFIALLIIAKIGPAMLTLGCRSHAPLCDFPMMDLSKWSRYDGSDFYVYVPEGMCVEYKLRFESEEYRFINRDDGRLLLRALCYPFPRFPINDVGRAPIKKRRIGKLEAEHVRWRSDNGLHCGESLVHMGIRNDVPQYLQFIYLNNDAEAAILADAIVRSVRMKPWD